MAAFGVQGSMGRVDLARKFELVFRRLLAREDVDLYAEDMSLMWEAVADTLFGNYRNGSGVTSTV